MANIHLHKLSILSLCAVLFTGCAQTAQSPAEPAASEPPAASAESAPQESTPASSAETEPQETVAPDFSNEEEVAIDNSDTSVDYSDPANWCYMGKGEDQPAEVFMIPATVYNIPEGNVALNNDTIRKEQAIINRMAGMTSDSCVIYAPAYRQKTMLAYVSDSEQEYTDYAYKDISDAFGYYLDNLHKEGRPIVLFGFSQGAEMAMYLMEEYFNGDIEESEKLRDSLVACYVIGYGVEKNFYDTHKNLHPAQEAADTGVIISFDAETPDVHDSITVRAGEEYAAINPLNWKTDSTRAEASENLGAVLVNAKGEIKFEQAEFCGAYLDDTPRHALKVDDLNYADYENKIAFLPVGSYHGYDITFFYRNIQENVTNRVNTWLKAHS